jgi:hypothetical protein
MGSALQRQVAQAVRAGMTLDELEQKIIDPALVDDEQKAAMWLYAEVLVERRADDALPIDAELVLG